VGLAAEEGCVVDGLVHALKKAKDRHCKQEKPRVSEYRNTYINKYHIEIAQ
jgi:hypothetical protein